MCACAHALLPSRCHQTNQPPVRHGTVCLPGYGFNANSIPICQPCIKGSFSAGGNSSAWFLGGNYLHPPCQACRYGFTTTANTSTAVTTCSGEQLQARRVVGRPTRMGHAESGQPSPMTDESGNPVQQGYHSQ